jgi:hypothetical protein
MGCLLILSASLWLSMALLYVLELFIAHWRDGYVYAVMWARRIEGIRKG